MMEENFTITYKDITFLVTADLIETTQLIYFAIRDQSGKLTVEFSTTPARAWEDFGNAIERLACVHYSRV